MPIWHLKLNHSSGVNRNMGRGATDGMGFPHNARAGDWCTDM